MKNSTPIPTENSQATHSANSTEQINEATKFNNDSTLNNTLLSSLPYPAMYIRVSDRIIIAANELAISLGAKVGGYCWREFGQSQFLSDDIKKIADKLTDTFPHNLNIKCSFCRGNECIAESHCQNNPELSAFGKIWDTYWIKVSDEVFLHYFIDVTEKKNLIKSLHDNELYLKHTQQIAMLGTYKLDIKTGVWESSEILDSILGITDKIKTIDSWTAVLHPDMKSLMTKYFTHEVIGKRQRFDKEYKIIRPIDGVERWVHGLGDLVLDENNEPIQMIGTIRDVTERKEEQIRVIRNLKFTEALLKSVPIPVFFKDSDGRYLGCNEAFTLQTGYSDEYIKGKTADDLWSSAQADIYRQKDMELLQTKGFQRYESKIPDQNNRLRDVIFAKNVFYNETSRVAGIVGTYVDVTEQKQVERELRSNEHKYKLLSENVADGIFTCRDGYIEYVNPAMCRIFGYEENDLEGLQFSKLVRSDQRAEFESFINLGPSYYQSSSIEFECIRKNKSVVSLEIFLNYVENESLVYGVLHDITLKKELQQRNIIKAIVQTEEQERANFSKELHDGLGPLLSAIKLYLQWSIRPNSNRSHQEIILKAEEIVEEALTTVKEISNKLSPHLLTNYGLASAIHSFTQKLVDTHSIDINFQHNFTRRIEMEVEVALYRAVIECINNTLKYANAKNIQIRLMDNKTHIKLEYSDDGKGFDIQKTFSERKGLGLFNLQNRIQTIGGQIQFYSKVNEGVSYNICVPTKQSEKA